jgi:putative integral membrane protein (TIGR02587 family)
MAPAAHRNSAPACAVCRGVTDARQSGGAQSATADDFIAGLGRAAAGALIFSLPMLMTMEMWWLGFTMPPLRLALMTALTLPMLVALSRFAGIRPTLHWTDDLADALVAVLVAGAIALVSLLLFGLLSPHAAPRDAVGKVMVQVVPGSLGAMLARSQLGGGGARGRDPSYGGELFLMGVGSLFLSFNLAPTQEIEAIAYKAGAWNDLGMVAASLLAMHAFVYSVDFRGGAGGDDVSFLSTFARYSLVGYMVVLAVSWYALWSFGRTDGLSPEQTLSIVVVLGLPGAVGAAAARLII